MRRRQDRERRGGDGSLLHLGAEVIGPILMGMRKPVHVLQRAVEVAVNMAAITVVDTQEKAADMPEHAPGNRRHLSSDASASLESARGAILGLYLLNGDGFFE